MSDYLFTIKARQAQWLHDGRDELGPRYFNDRTYKVTGSTEKQAIAKAEKLYGHKQDEDNGDDWVEMSVTEVTDLLATDNKPSTGTSDAPSTAPSKPRGKV